ncbi:hypothetical protein QIW49_01670 [Francisellaceae bacterium CB300]
MNQIEEKYRKTSKSSKNHAKYLFDYIILLKEKNRILEANFYFQELSISKPKCYKTHIVGYELAIKSFDNESVKKFDSLLSKKKLQREELFCLRLKYYYSVNKQACFEELISYILIKTTITRKTLHIILPMVLNQNNYKLIYLLLKYLKNRSLQISNHVEKKIRKIILQELIDNLTRIVK